MLRSAILLFFLALSQGACTTMTLVPEYGHLGVNSEQVRFWHHSFLFGLWEASGPIEPKDYCEFEWAQVRTRRGPWQVATYLFTGGLYTPLEVQIQCLAEPSTTARVWLPTAQPQ